MTTTTPACIQPRALEIKAYGRVAGPTPEHVLFGGGTGDIPVDETTARCSIRPGYLDVSPIPIQSACNTRSLEVIRAFLHAHPVLRSYEMLLRRRVCERSVLVATEILGGDHGLTPAEVDQKAQYHLLLSAGMVLDWLLDDTLDVNAWIPRDFSAAVVGLYADVLESDPPDAAARAETLRAESLRIGVASGFVDALLLLVRWRRALSIALGIPVGASSMSVGGEGGDEPLTQAALAWVIELHNERLTELAARAAVCADPHESAVLLACVQATWSIHVLHHQFMTIYSPGCLTKALNLQPSSGARPDDANVCASTP